jgi:hypothetical protein
MTAMRSHRLVLLLAASGLALAACATDHGLPEDRAWGVTAAEESAPLGGEALAMMKSEMARAHRDMRHFHATLQGLQHRRDRSGSILFAGFLDQYMGAHLEPLLRSEWQSDHPELMALDANLRFAVAEVLIQLRDPRRVEDVIDEIARRFEGRESMLVDYPLDGQGTLGEGLRILRERKWRG